MKSDDKMNDHGPTDTRLFPHNEEIPLPLPLFGRAAPTRPKDLPQNALAGAVSAPFTLTWKDPDLGVLARVAARRGPQGDEFWAHVRSPYPVERGLSASIILLGEPPTREDRSRDTTEATPADPEDIRRLGGVLRDDEDAVVRAGVAEVLGSLGDLSATESLAHALRHDEDEAVRRAAAAALGALGEASSDVADVLRHDEDETVRRGAAALEGLGRDPRTEDHDPIDRLDRPDRYLRYSVKLDTPDDGGSEGTARLGTVREIRERLGASVQLVAFLVETTRPRGGERA